jgi:uncharacterized repeat protein (TIGR04076 family)
MNETFKLYGLTVTVIGDKAAFVCKHNLGLAFRVEGEDLIFSENNKFSLYALASLIPLLPAKQRATHVNDWMSSDDIIACPDPNCGAKFKISRTNHKTFKRSGTTTSII